MRLDKFDLNQLIALDALLEERNVTQAAKRLHIGQSAASASLKRLREYFDDILLVPVGQHMELSPLAKNLVGPVRDTLMRARATIALRPDFKPNDIRRSFSIAATDYLVGILISKVMPTFAKQSPKMQLEISSPPPEFRGVFDRGEIDLLFIPKQYAEQLDHPQIELFRDTQVCLVCENNPVTELTMDDYLALEHVSVRVGEKGSSAHEEWFLPRYGRQRHIACTVDHFNTAALLLLNTNRILTIHRRIAEKMITMFPVRMLPPPMDMEPFIEMMAWPRYLNDDPAHEWLRTQFKRVADAISQGN